MMSTSDPVSAHLIKPQPKSGLMKRHGHRKDWCSRAPVVKFYKTRFAVMITTYTDALPPDWEPLAAVFAELGDSYRQLILIMFERGERLSITLAYAEESL